MEHITSYMNGRWMDSGKSVDRYNPGNLDEVAFSYRFSDRDTAHKSMATAEDAFSEWKAYNGEKRSAILQEWLDRIEASKETIAEVITRESGKTLNESRSEIHSALSDARYLIAQFEKESQKEWLVVGTSDIRAGIIYEPAGVYVLITPWNFPMATLLRKMVPALLYGNTVVVKPSEFASATPCLAFQLLDNVENLSDGVANLILGEGSAVGPSLVEHDALRGISFTGSTATGKHIMKQVAERNIRLQMEMGGKNGLVIFSDADLNDAVQAVITGAFSCAGQWCTGTSRVIVEQDVLSEFCEKLINKVEQIKVGPGHLNDTDMGPVINEAHFEAILNEISYAKSQGGNVLTGGNAIPEISGCRGWFIEPTVISEVTPEMDLYQKEIFGPVLAVTTAESTDDALYKVNNSEYGLAFSIYTGSPQKGEEFIQEVEAGICHVNLHTAYRRPDLPIFGWKESGRGVPECGTYGRYFFTQPKAVYIGG